MYTVMYSVYLLNKVDWISYLSEIITFTVTHTRGVFSAYQVMCLNHNFTKVWGEWPLVFTPLWDRHLDPSRGPAFGDFPSKHGSEFSIT